MRPWKSKSSSTVVFGVGATSVVGVEIDGLPIEESFRKAVVRRVRTVLTSKKTGIIRNQAFSADQSFDVHFTPISRDNVELDGVLIMFGPLNTQGQKLAEKSARAKHE